ncbi:RNA-splicing ligase RtcB, repairs tRNA damage [Butyrivibrio sp. INlla16]|nr:RtcB family protein [Butyrivibrio sp. INlla16]SDB13973.1 RNA-splicing ligase RtcB, repairs tRNA damage [Butyrivibrio sp. INlla16]
MIPIKGIFTEAHIMCDQELEGSDVDQYALAQVQMICDNKASEGSVIRVMPDVHPGKVGPIGLTMTIGERILPSLVGIDIGCGMLAVKVGKIRNDYQKLDTVIRDNVPVGFKVRNTVHRDADIDLSRLCCYKHIRSDKALLSIGTLGGGNHFIELDQDDSKETYMIIHTGSRHLGKEVAEYYMAAGQKVLKEQGITDVPYEMTYLSDQLMEDYLNDLSVVQEYAELNRKVIASEIIKSMKWKEKEVITCIHNYVDFSEIVPILRKGAISAKENEDVIIPINMRDGVILGRGKGNAEWNNSAPHGSGRITSRDETVNTHTVSEFKASMKGIYSSCISKDTLDEAPFAYRGVDYIKEAVKDTVEISRILKPVYNYKGGNA